MNRACPFRPGLVPSRSVCVLLTLGTFLLLLIASGANAQDAAEAARQEKTRKAARPHRQSHVYTNEDLQRRQILTPEDRAPVEAHRNNSLSPAAKGASNAAAEEPSSPESLGEIARRVRREKAARQAEQARKAPPPSLFPMELPHEATLARPKPLGEPLLAPSPSPSKTVRPSLGTGAGKRDPFSRALISPAPRNSISSSAPLPVVPPSVVRSSPVESKNHPDTIRIQSGDSLWNLSLRYLGKGSRWQEWLTSNPQLGDPRRMQPGAVLVVPRFEPHSESRSELQAIPRSTAQPPDTVSVQPGDSLWKIAATHFGHGSLWTCLAHANPDLQNVSLIYPGQTLFLPSACTASPAP